MGESLPPSQNQVNAYAHKLAEHLVNVPEVQPAIDLAEAQPELVGQTFARYTDLINRLANLSPEEQSAIQNAKKRLSENNGQTGSADETTAAELVEKIGDKTVLPGIAERALSESPATDEALTVLAERMEGGHQLKLDGKTPTDGDDESNKVIWGHTQITNPTALLNFTICHYLERYYAIELADRGIEAAHNKDFFLNALIDVVILDHLTSKQFEDLYGLWRQPKPEGLGWVVQGRLDSYSNP